MSEFSTKLLKIIGNDKSYAGINLRSHAENQSSVHGYESFRNMNCEVHGRSIPDDRGGLVMCYLNSEFVRAINSDQAYKGCESCGERFTCPVPKHYDNTSNSLSNASGLPVADRLFFHIGQQNEKYGQVLYRFAGLLLDLACSDSTLYRIARESGCLRAEDRAIIMQQDANPDNCAFCKNDACRFHRLELPVAQGRKETRQINEITKPEGMLRFLQSLIDQNIILLNPEHTALAIGAGKANYEAGVLKAIGLNNILSVDSTFEPNAELGINREPKDIMTFLAEHIIQDNPEKFTFATMFGVEFLYEKENILAPYMFEMLHHLMTYKGAICIDGISYAAIERIKPLVSDLFDIHVSSPFQKEPDKTSVFWLTSSLKVVLSKKPRVESVSDQNIDPIDTFDGKPSLSIEESIRILRCFGLPESLINRIKNDRAQLSERAKYLLLEHHLDAIPEDHPIREEDHWSEHE